MIFDFRDYKKYLNTALSTEGANRGSRSRLAEKLRCQTAFISHVLNGNSHFSLEHAVVISQFLGHTPEESRYFILLVSLGRAGTKALEEHFNTQIAEIQRKRTQIKERISTDRSLSLETQMRYYSAWYYSAIHVATSIPQCRTRDAIATALGLAPALVAECLEFLMEHSLVITEKGRYTIGPVRIHLGADSPIISKMHSNWRLQALQSLERPISATAADLHYSGAITLSRKDAKRIRDVLLKAIDQTEQIFRPSSEEVVYCVAMDWFHLSNGSANDLAKDLSDLPS
jgi:uncharacterized protein (TIGR02147 family)